MMEDHKVIFGQSKWTHVCQGTRYKTALVLLSPKETCPFCNKYRAPGDQPGSKEAEKIKGHKTVWDKTEGFLCISPDHRRPLAERKQYQINKWEEINVLTERVVQESEPA